MDDRQEKTQNLAKHFWMTSQDNPSNGDEVAGAHITAEWQSDNFIAEGMSVSTVHKFVLRGSPGQEVEKLT